MSKTSIEWADDSWNPVTGCTKVSQGCKHCYAEGDANRMKHNPNPKVAYRYRNGFGLTLQEDRLEEPLHWRKPRIVFVCSMGDLFHKDVPDEYLHRVFAVMQKATQHTFLVLTKRARRMDGWIHWPDNVWAGVSVESTDHLERIDYLRQTDAAFRFLSLEPLLGALPDLDLQGIGWVIVGDESGSKARPAELEWVREIRDQCLVSAVPFFFKQWRGVKMPTVDGRVWGQNPAAWCTVPVTATHTAKERKVRG